MKAVVDDKIPYIRQAIESVADEVTYLPGREISRRDVSDADVLIVRTRTRCDRDLLHGSRVQMIATATIGYDHIDTAWCEANGIEWTNCPGCNAASVAQYVQSALILLSRRHHRPLRGMTMGIIGVGNVGSRVAEMAAGMGIDVLLNDPPRAEAEGGGRFVTFGELAGRADIITLHTPLARGGKHPTYHLADAELFAQLEKKPWLLNTSRGEVADTGALIDALAGGRIADAVIDVWEHEPDIDRRLLAAAYLTTPHIAGYSADGKANASRMAMQAVCRHFGIAMPCTIEPPAPPCPTVTAPTIDDALLTIYDPRRDSDALRQDPTRFEWLRGNYPMRREAGAYNIILTK